MKIKRNTPRILGNLIQMDDFLESYQDAEEQIFSEVLLTEIEITGGEFYEIDFSAGRIEKCRFMDADFEKSSFVDVIFKDCDFSNCHFGEAYFNRCEFINCKCVGTDYHEAVCKQTGFLECQAPLCKSEWYLF